MLMEVAESTVVIFKLIEAFLRVKGRVCEHMGIGIVGFIELRMDFFELGF